MAAFDTNLLNYFHQTTGKKVDIPMYSLSLYPVLTSQLSLSMELGSFMTFSGGKCFLVSSEKKTPNTCCFFLDIIGMTALHMSIDNQHEKCVQLLLEYGADATLQGKNGFNALHYAATKGSSNCMKTLLKYQTDMDALTASGGTPLDLAAQRGHVGIMQALLAHLEKSKSNRTSQNKQSALSVACFLGHRNVAKVLLEHELDVNKITNDFTALGFAAANGRDNCVSLLVSYNANVNMRDNSNHTALVYAVMNKHEACVSTLLEANADVNMQYNNRTLLHMAANTIGNGSCLRLLLEKKPNVEAKFEGDFTPIFQCTDIDCLQVLLEYGADINAKCTLGRTVMHYSCFNRPQEMVKLLLDKNADVNACDANKETPLHIACHAKRAGIVELLLDHGADMTVTSTIGLTPLQLAVLNGDVGSVKQFLMKTRPLNISGLDKLSTGPVSQHIGTELKERLLTWDYDWNGISVSPLMCAVYKKHTFITKLLLESGAQVNLSNQYGISALHIAALQNTYDILALLLGQGANANGVALNNKVSSLHLACLYGDEKSIELLLKNGSTTVEKTTDGCNVQHYSCTRKEDDYFITEFLICNGAASLVDDRSSDGSTPCHVAALHGNVKSLEVLLKSSADVSIKDNSNKTAFDIAEKMGHSVIMEMLKVHENDRSKVSIESKKLILNYVLD